MLISRDINRSKYKLNMISYHRIKDKSLQVTIDIDSASTPNTRCWFLTDVGWKLLCELDKARTNWYNDKVSIYQDNNLKIEKYLIEDEKLILFNAKKLLGINLQYN